MDKFGSVVDRMNMKLGSRFLNSLRIKPQLLKRLQRVIVVEAPPTPKGMVWRVTEERGSLKDGAEAFLLFQHGAQLVLWSSVLTVLDLVR